ncbi:hypothetical protein BGZ63DRAFT_427313 [Mariannaea sp. PMI_226]|nr:hypothetical protein BGZ63DRAFT_427313 [Mariannaea sp. PMI_226]
MAPTAPQRRYLFLTIGFIFLTVVIFYSTTSGDFRKVKAVIPSNGKANSDSSTASVTAPASTEASDSKEVSEDEDPDEPIELSVPTAPAETTPASEQEPNEPDNNSSEDEDEDEDKGEKTTDLEKVPASSDKIKTSKFHYLVPASGNNRRLCFNLVSSAANRYPVPVLVGWNATGLLSAANTHLAKLHVIQRYLDRLPEEEDDDIVLIVDGYDVIMQLPPDIMLKRYFDALHKENTRNAKRFGITMGELYEKGLETTLFFGADKICWPIDWRAPRCWAVPQSTMDPKAFGEKTNNGDMNYLIPRWLNSGTLIGPANHMRDYIRATLYEILNTYDVKYGHSESDQFYLANVWGRQEYYRSRKFAEDGKVEGGPTDRFLPRIYDKLEPIEYHVGIEYDSAMFQTKAGYERWNDWIRYNGGNGENAPVAKVEKDLKDEKEAFKPYDIQMPDDIQEALRTIYDEIEDAHPNTQSSQWIRGISLGTNYITKNIWALWHVTGDKDVIEEQFTKFWFFPYARSLLKSTVRRLQTTNEISKEPIGGRYWVHKTVYPDEQSLTDELGGAWSDEDGARWIDYSAMCKEWDDEVLAGEKDSSSQVKPMNSEIPPPPEKNQ